MSNGGILEDGGFWGAIIAGGVALIGWVQSAVRMGAEQKTQRERLDKLEACVMPREEIFRETADIREDLTRLREDIRSDFRGYQKMFCTQIAEIKVLIEKGEGRRESARDEIAAHREAVARELGEIRNYMRGGQQ
jgi:hypothetical protein